MEEDKVSRCGLNEKGRVSALFDARQDEVVGVSEHAPMRRGLRTS